MLSDRIRTVFLQNCTGFGGKQNDVLFVGCPERPSSNVIYFGGDIQDIESKMHTHPDGKTFIKWSLEATGRLLVERFYLQGRNVHIWVIRPSQWVSTVFASYRNFVPVDSHGNPLFTDGTPSQTDIVEHLSTLVEDAACKLRKERPDIVSGFEDTKLDIMGFSKGCCVLTALLYLLSVVQPYSLRGSRLPEPSSKAIHFLSNIRALYWLDAGHSAIDQQWPTTEMNLATLKADKCPELHVYATPYQVEDLNRPWKAKDYNTFIGLLTKYGLPNKHGVLLTHESPQGSEKSSQDRDLQTHFNILQYFPI